MLIEDDQVCQYSHPWGQFKKKEIHTATCMNSIMWAAVERSG